MCLLVALTKIVFLAGLLLGIFRSERNWKM